MTCEWHCLKCQAVGDDTADARSHAWSENHRVAVDAGVSRWVTGPHDPWVPHGTCHHLIYRLSCDQFDALLKRADRRCEICRSAEKLAIDHDHTTDEVRGLLCPGCNSRLARVDNGHRAPNSAEAAYLATPQGVCGCVCHSCRDRFHCQGSYCEWTARLAAAVVAYAESGVA